MNDLSIPAFPTRLNPLTEDEIRSSWRLGYEEPLVSICCATYNHVLWIEDALCGFLAQRTDFPFEIIIRDDASIDGTIDVIKRYASMYPSIIRVVFNRINQYSLGYEPANAWPSLARGTYIAICEGDDFWISNEKLKNQVELMMAHKRAVMCVGLSHYFVQNKKDIEYYRTTEAPRDCEIECVQESFYLPFHTSTLLFNSDVYGLIVKKYWKRGMLDDTALRSFMILYGSIVVLPKVVSIYRITGRGMFSSQNYISQLEWAYKIYQYLYEQLPRNHSYDQVPRLYGVASRLVRAHLWQKKWRPALYWSSQLALQFGFRVWRYLGKVFR